MAERRGPTGELSEFYIKPFVTEREMKRKEKQKKARRLAQSQGDGRGKGSLSMFYIRSGVRENYGLADPDPDYRMGKLPTSEARERAGLRGAGYR